MDTVFLQLQQELNNNRPVVLLTVVSSKGSAPRHEGTHQLILSDGSSVGTVGGGFQEYKACEMGRQCLAAQTSKLLALKLHSDEEGDIGAVCGGELHIFCQYIAGNQCNVADCIKEIIESSQNHRRCYFVLDISRASSWSMAVVSNQVLCCGRVSPLLQNLTGREKWLSQGDGVSDIEGKHVYCETVSYPGRVFIFGGGHVAHALVPVLTRLGFDCVVADDRMEFANAERFPEAKTVVVDYNAVPPDLGITSDDYICIMTRGHLADYEVQRQIMEYQPQYVGVIGSQAKLAFVKDKLIAAGITEEAIDRCYAPIGLPISAATPEEIAVSVAAELIAVRACREGRGKANARQWVKP